MYALPQIQTGRGVYPSTKEQRVLQAVRYLKVQGVPLYGENARMLVRHLYAALERAECGEKAAAMADCLLHEIQREPAFCAAQPIAEGLGKLIPELPREESCFLALHIGVLLEQNLSVQRTSSLPSSCPV